MTEHPFPLNLLNGWPEGTKGRENDNWLIAAMQQLGNKYGYDQIASICKKIEAIWRTKFMLNPVGMDDLQDIDDNREVVEVLNELCQRHGYGRIPQLAEGIADVKLRPETIQRHQAFYEARMELMEATVRHYNE